MLLLTYHSGQTWQRGRGSAGRVLAPGLCRAQRHRFEPHATLYFLSLYCMSSFIIFLQKSVVSGDGQNEKKEVGQHLNKKLQICQRSIHILRRVAQATTQG